MLSNLQFKSVYRTDIDDIANEFYIPALSDAVMYKRVSGYFSSAALSLFSKGLEKLVSNNGRYKLLISNHISENDFKLIQEGYYKREQIKKEIEKKLNDYSSLSLSQKQNFSNLAFLIQISILDIKIGFTHNGLFHSKYGIISDDNNNKIYFSGSLNETQAAFMNNYESITVIKSWTNLKDREIIDIQEEHFDKLWNNKIKSFIYVKEFDEIVKSSIIKYSKGRIIMDSTLLTEDALVLYFEKNNLKIEDNLISNRVDERERRIKKLKRLYLIDEKLWDFKKNLTYKEVSDIITILQQYERKTGIKVAVSQSVLNFIESKKFEIFDISNRGLMIKNKDDSLKERYKQFNKIVSNEISRSLRPIQSWVSFYMAMMQRVGNFSVPGSGKTAMVYGAYAYLSSEYVNEVNQIVMIGPKSSFKSWKDEFTFVFGEKKKLKVLDIHAENFHPSMLSKNIANYNLILINYESMAKYQEQLESIINFRTMLIFDEVHKIKKINGERASVALKISKLSKYRYVLTGTPIPNGYEDTWNFLNILYEEEYQGFFGFSKNQLSNMDSVSAQRFNEILYPFYWRVTKKELDVPPVEPDNIYISTATDSEQDIINMLWRKYRKSPFILYTRLIQFSSNPSLLKENIDKTLFINKNNDDYLDDDNTDEIFNYEYLPEMDDIPNYSVDELELINSLKVSSKFENAILKAKNLVQENKTVLIWCIFIDTMHKVVNQLKEDGYKVAMIYGNTTSLEREAIISKFQNNEYDVLVTNPHTLAESVSLHGVCHDAIYLEYSFNLTHMLQSRDRIHRLGLKDTDKTNYYYFMLEGQVDSRNTIDEKIYYRLKNKEQVMIDTIEGTKISIDFSFDEKEEIINLMSKEIEF